VSRPDPHHALDDRVTAMEARWTAMEARWASMERAAKTTRPMQSANLVLFNAVREVIVPRVMPIIAAGATWMGDLFPEAPSGLVPWRNQTLYVLARRAFYGDWGDRENYLRALGVEPTSKTVLLVGKALASTFAPSKPWKRTAWERQSRRMATEFHRRSLKDKREDERKKTKKRAKHETLTDPEEMAEQPDPDPRQQRDPRTFWELDLRELRVRNDIYATLPPAHAEVVWMLTKYFDEEHARASSRFVADRLGMSPATVRWYRAEARKHPDLRRKTGL
jgi:hypothetical protein